MRSLIIFSALIFMSAAVSAQVSDSAKVRKVIHTANIYTGEHGTVQVKGFVVETEHLDLRRNKWILTEDLDPVIALAADKKTVIKPPFTYKKLD